MDYAGEVGKNIIIGAGEAAVASPLRGYGAQTEPTTLYDTPQGGASGTEVLARVMDFADKNGIGVEEARTWMVAQGLLKATPHSAVLSPEYRAGEAVSGMLKGEFPDRNLLNPVVRDIASGLGSVGGNIATALIPGVRMAGIPNLVAQGAGEGAERAVKAGATPEQIQRAAQLGNISGATEFADAMIPMLGSTGKVLGFLGRVGERIAKGAFIEGGQEGLQQLIQNIIAKGIYNPKQDLTEDVAYNALIGAIVGGGVSGIIGGGKTVPEQVGEEVPAQVPPGTGVGAGPTIPTGPPSEGVVGPGEVPLSGGPGVTTPAPGMPAEAPLAPPPTAAPVQAPLQPGESPDDLVEIPGTPVKVKRSMLPGILNAMAKGGVTTTTAAPTEAPVPSAPAPAEPTTAAPVPTPPPMSSGNPEIDAILGLGPLPPAAPSEIENILGLRPTKPELPPNVARILKPEPTLPSQLPTRASIPPALLVGPPDELVTIPGTTTQMTRAELNDYLNEEDRLSGRTPAPLEGEILPPEPSEVKRVVGPETLDPEVQDFVSKKITQLTLPTKGLPLSALIKRQKEEREGGVVTPSDRPLVQGFERSDDPRVSGGVFGRATSVYGPGEPIVKLQNGL
jgi:hypothetical protein